MSPHYTSNQPFRRSPLPNNKQGGRERGVFFERAGRGKPNMSDSVYSGEIGNSLSTKILPHTSVDKRLVTSGKLAQVPSSRSSPISPQELGEINKWLFYFGVIEGISNSISVIACSTLASSPSLDGPGSP